MTKRAAGFSGLAGSSGLTGLLVCLSLLLTACGLFGDSDETASPVDEAVVEPASVRVEFGDRWLDIDPASIELNASGEPTAASLSALTNVIENLSAETSRATNAEIEFDGNSFVVVPSVDGAEPDINAFAVAIAERDDATTVGLPYMAVPAEVSDRAAQSFADRLNQRLGDGLEVSVGGDSKTLTKNVVGSATTVRRVSDEWVVSVDFDGIDGSLESLFGDLRTEGGEASFTIEPGETDEDPSTVVIIPGAPSVICCDERAATQIERVLMTQRRPINLLLTTEDGERGTEWAESLGITELVASFSTRYTPGQSRNINIQRIAELTTGVVIEPGESFSLNQFVGQRTIENGFVPAGTIVNGHLVDSVGGGISQYVTTLFNTSFFAGLEFERYQSHSIYFSRYPYGREATISWPAPAFEISNPTPYGILIWPIATDRGITVEMYSTKWVDVEQTGQTQRPLGVACTRVTTERTRTFLDGTTEPIVDSVIATYREEGIACDGTETVNPDDTTTTSTTIDPDAPTTSVDPNAPTTSVDPNAPTTTVDPNAPTTTVTTTSVAPTSSTTTTSSTTSSTTTSSTTTTSTTSSTTTTTAPETTTEAA